MIPGAKVKDTYILRNTKLKERLTNHMYPKDKSESDLINNCLSGTMSLGANLLSIFVPSYFLTVTYSKNQLNTMNGF